MIRSIAAPLLFLAAVVFETCTVPIPWAVQGTPQPLPSTAPADAAVYSALLEDSLLTDGDLPFSDVTSTTSQGWSVVQSERHLFVGFPDGGGRWVASQRSTQPIPGYGASYAPGTEYATFTDQRLLFGSAEEAQAFFAAHPSPLPDNYVQLPEVSSFAPDTHVFSEAASPEPNLIPMRRIQVRSIVGRIVIQQFLSLHQESDWEGVTRQLLESARQRTDEALAAAGE